MPAGIKARLVELVEVKLSDMNLTGLERPLVQVGTAGPDARSLGAASLPLSERYLLEG